MKIGIFDPYLDTLGGGERYIFSIASCLSSKNSVDIFWNNNSILQSAEKKFGFSLQNIHIIPDIFSANFLKKITVSKAYDAIFYISDGSIPFLFAKKNFLIFQFPVNWVKSSNIMTKLKLRNITSALVYSGFVKGFIDETFGLQSVILPPAVPSIGEKGRKENMILNVGRFTSRMNAKKQDMLIQAFIKMQKNGLTKWKLVLIGSYLPSDSEYVEKLKEMSKGYPIDILTDIPFIKLCEYYQKAKIYWHAAGFGEDLFRYPERAEHFGITTVEAMSAGVVPVVINAGGQKEIVTDSVNGLLWDTEEELVSQTTKLIHNNELFTNLSKKASKRAKDFSEDMFCSHINKLLI